LVFFSVFYVGVEKMVDECVDDDCVIVFVYRLFFVGLFLFLFV